MRWYTQPPPRPCRQLESAMREFFWLFFASPLKMCLWWTSTSFYHLTGCYPALILCVKFRHSNSYSWLCIKMLDNAPCELHASLQHTQKTENIHCTNNCCTRFVLCTFCSDFCTIITRANTAVVARLHVLPVIHISTAQSLYRSIVSFVQIHFIHSSCIITWKKWLFFLLFCALLHTGMRENLHRCSLLLAPANNSSPSSSPVFLSSAVFFYSHFIPPRHNPADIATLTFLKRDLLIKCAAQ